MKQATITIQNGIENLNGLLLGLFISANMMIKLFITFIPFENMLVFYYIFIIICIFLVNKFRLNLKYLFLYMIISLLFCFSMLRVDNPTYTFQYLIYFNCFYLGSSILQYQINYKKTFWTINNINVLYTCYLFFIIFEQYNQGNLDNNYTMDLSYTCLIGIASFLFTITSNEFRCDKKFLSLIVSICVLTELYFMFFISYNRGALLGLTVLIFFIFLIKINYKTFRYLFLGCSTILIIYLVNNFFDFLYKIANFLLEHNISSNLLTKSLYSLSNDNFDSGRSQLYDDALSLFYNYPIFGNGIGHFSSLHKGQYPHNLFLEALTDQGLFITVILLIFCLFCIQKIVNVKQNNIVNFAIFLFSISIPGLLVSSTIWMNSFFWLLVVLILINPNFNEKNIHKASNLNLIDYSNNDI